MDINRHRPKIEIPELYESWVDDLVLKGVDSLIYEDESALGSMTNTIHDKMELLSDLPKINQLFVKLDRIELEHLPFKTKYTVGDELDLTGLIVKAYYDDGTSKIVTDYTTSVNDGAILTKDDSNIVISFTHTDKTATITQEIVIDRVLSDISITNPPDVLIYDHGDEFNTTGMIVTAHFSDCDDVITDYTIVPDRALLFTDTEVTIQYEYFGETYSVSQGITVNNADNIYTTIYSTKNVGDIVTVPHEQFGDIDFIVIGKDQDGDGNVTLLSKNIIKIMPFDAAEPGNSIGDGYRATKGNNRYLYSNILQWMNSEASSDWFTAKHSYDAIPNSSNVDSGYNPYDDIPGFLYGFNKDFKDVLCDVNKITVVSSYDGGSYERVSSKMFILSNTELGLGNTYGITEGSVYTYFSNGATKLAYPSEYAISNSTYTHEVLTVNDPWFYWTRTPVYDFSCREHFIGNDGVLYNTGDSFLSNVGLRVACVINSEYSDSSKTLESIAITTPPSRTYYNDGDTFDGADMVVTATYADGVSHVISKYTIDNPIVSAENTTMTIRYTLNDVTKTCTYDVSISDVNPYAALYDTKNVGDVITIPHEQFGDIDFLVIGKDHDGEGTLTLLSKNIIKIMCFDARETGNTDSNRASYGNNRYLYSNILQWMNSDKESKWYISQHNYDIAPTNVGVDGYNVYDNIPGFLYGFNNDFKEVLTTVTKKTVIPTCDGGGYENVNSKMFLLSTTEVGLANENSIAEGTIYQYFSNNNTDDNRKALVSDYAADVNNMVVSLYGSNNIIAGEPWFYWLRTPNSASGDDVRGVYGYGAMSNCNSCACTYGLRVACTISNIDSKKRVLKSMRIETPPTKTQYNHGEIFERGGMTVCVTYSDGTESFISDYTIDKTKPLNWMTDTSVNISYTLNGITKTCSYPISVTRVMTKIEIVAYPRLSYTDIEWFSLRGLSLKVSYSDNRYDIVTFNTDSHPNVNIKITPYDNPDDVNRAGILRLSDNYAWISYTVRDVTLTETIRFSVSHYNKYKYYYYRYNVGDLVYIPNSVYGYSDYRGEMIFRVIGKDQDGPGTMTMIAAHILKLMPFDAKEPTSTNSDHRSKGNNDYKLSNIHQWLNSSADKSSWYTAQHTYDNSPSTKTINKVVREVYNGYTAHPGFLYGFEEDFRDALVTTYKWYMDPNRYNDSKIPCKAFLPSAIELGCEGYDDVIINTSYVDASDKYFTYQYFKKRDNGLRWSPVAYYSPYAASHNNNPSVDSTKLKAYELGGYRLRTITRTSNYLTGYITTEGTVNISKLSATGSGLNSGVRPCIVLGSA